jgi:hypothetical protein
MKKTNLGAQAQGPKLDISKTLPIVCDNTECGNDMFITAMKFRKIPKLLLALKMTKFFQLKFICVHRVVTLIKSLI